MSEPKVRLLCPYCGSKEIVADACAEWDETLQI